jgi:hypothetical protein
LSSSTYTLALGLAFAFLYYGVLCLSSKYMVLEFERYRLAPFRKLVGALEVLGGLGVLFGLWFSPLMVLATSGLALLMLLGVFARLRIRDSIGQMLPALFLMAISLYVLYQAGA